ncbi:MAG: hypothetical protein IKJ17_02365 [Clostridia bacterium]|nr:hypothetical protein [Clostridia bacterium]
MVNFDERRDIMKCNVMCGKSLSGIIGQNILTFMPDLENISYFKNKIDAIITKDNCELSHNYIFLKYMNTTVVTGVKDLRYGDKVTIDTDSSTVTVIGKCDDVYRPAIYSSVVSVPFAHSGYPVGLWRTEGMLIDGVRDFSKEYIMFSELEPNGVIRLFDFEGDKLSLACGMEERLKEKQLFDISCLEKANILIPNVRNSGDVRYIRGRLSSMCGGNKDFKIGAMIENVSGYCSVASIIAECDFISIGLNGLCREFMSKEKALAAAVRTTDLATKAGKTCTACGEIITDPIMFKTLTACGISGVCLSPEDIHIAEELLSVTKIPDQLCFL